MQVFVPRFVRRSGAKADTCPRLVFCIGFHEYRGASSRGWKLDVNRKWLADPAQVAALAGRTAAEQKEPDHRRKDHSRERKTSLSLIGGGEEAVSRIACPF